MSYFRWDSKVFILRINYNRSLKILLPAQNYQNTKVIKKKKNKPSISRSISKNSLQMIQ